MTFKKLLRTFTWIAVFAASLGAAHALVNINQMKIAYYFAKQMVPSYVPITDEHAYRSGFIINESALKEDARLTADLRDCYDRLETYFHSVCNNIFSLSQFSNAIKYNTLGSEGKAGLVALGHQDHSQRWQWKELDPVAKELPKKFDLAFQVLYGLLALYALSALTRWFMGDGIRAMGAGLGRLKESVPIFCDFKSMAYKKKLRQAEKDFSTLKNLYENKLITEEMYLRRRGDLKAVLENSTAVNKDNVY